MFFIVGNVFLSVCALLVFVFTHSMGAQNLCPTLSGVSYSLPPATHYTAPHEAAFSPDGSYLATANNFTAL